MFEVNKLDLSKGMPAKVHVQTTITQNNDTEEFVFDEKGKVVQMGGSYYVRYEETYQEDGRIPVTFKIEPNGIVTLTRKGDMTTRMRFEQGKSYETLYRTAQGNIFVDTITRHLQISYTDKPFSGNVQVAYDLFVGNEKLGEYKIRLLFTV
ncbi:MAG: DUF1934 domain-containing protein [Desemzia incerta]|uniref:DUF1934 domain-containing protein n=1 Tax=Desemzia TaxID=82800 RepID=UPI001CB71433|nr:MULTISPECIES: DUF1934 domain-containing protein [Desemzia]MCI3028943.1 DUF1934 domain-containing protein [Desemzia sp. C1]WHZ33016.1 DUF1934 domain-containing protein [Desemzia incerta]